MNKTNSDKYVWVKSCYLKFPQRITMAWLFFLKKVSYFIYAFSLASIWHKTFSSARENDRDRFYDLAVINWPGCRPLCCPSPRQLRGGVLYSLGSYPHGLCVAMADICICCNCTPVAMYNGPYCILCLRSYIATLQLCTSRVVPNWLTCFNYLLLIDFSAIWLLVLTTILISQWHSGYCVQCFIVYIHRWYNAVWKLQSRTHNNI